MEPQEGHWQDSQTDGHLGRLNQTALSEVEEIMAKEPREVPCEWCGDPSVVAVHRTRKGLSTATYIYACGVHKEIAEENATIVKRR